jgi:hypothetical protein
MSRDELKFQKFIDRLQNQFSDLFDQLMKVQLALKGLMTPDEWATSKEYVYFDFIKDNYFTELKKAEIMRERLGLLSLIDSYTGTYYSKAFIRKNVLHLNDDEIKEMEKELEEEAKEAEEKGLPPPIGGVAQQQQQLMMQQQSDLQQQQANTQPPQQSNPATPSSSDNDSSSPKPKPTSETKTRHTIKYE